MTQRLQQLTATAEKKVRYEDDFFNIFVHCAFLDSVPKAIYNNTNTLVCHREKADFVRDEILFRIPSFKNYERQSRGYASRAPRPD